MCRWQTVRALNSVQQQTARSVTGARKPDRRNHETDWTKRNDTRKRIRIKPMKITVALLLLLLFVPNRIVGQANSDPIQGSNLPPEQIKKHPIHISDEFREVADDAFDKVQALQAVELKGKPFYKPVLRDR